MNGMKKCARKKYAEELKELFKKMVVKKRVVEISDIPQRIHKLISMLIPGMVVHLITIKVTFIFIYCTA